MTLLGAVLAGGKGRRFGSDKALAIWNGKPLVWHASVQLQPHVAQTVICGRREPIFGINAIPDFPASDIGPLGGLCAGLRYARQRNYRGVLSIACDTPKLPPDLIENLSRVAGPTFAADSPVIGYWPVSLSECLELYLSEQTDVSMRTWIRTIHARPLADGMPIPNINTIAELRELE